MKMMNKFCALMLSVALCAGMAAPAFAYAEFSALQSGSAELRTKLETLQPDMPSTRSGASWGTRCCCALRCSRLVLLPGAFWVHIDWR